ncbi:MAG: hypothetical protein N2689_06945 [Verrucomicrobiae bacterium]|nr:hypothetical protein [Verrucomicrobiae bacterium]
MGWFRKKQGLLDRQLRDLEKQLRQIDAQVRQLQRSPAKALGKFAPAPTAARTGHRAFVQPEPGATPAQSDLRLPRERDLWSRASPDEQQARPRRREPWWRSLLGTKARPSDPRLVSYLSTGSFKTVRPLRYERRMARYRYTIGFVLLGGITLLLVFALQKCG